MVVVTATATAEDIYIQDYLSYCFWAMAIGVLTGWEIIQEQEADREEHDLRQSLEDLEDISDIELDAENEIHIDPKDKAFIADLVAKVVLFCEELSGAPLFPYQKELALRIVESLVIGDGEEITALWSRQSGKTQSVSLVIAGCMVIFPKLAVIYPSLMEKFKDGLMVGVFAPVEEQAQTLFSRIVDWLTSDRAVEIMLDPEIDDAPTGKGKLIRLKKSKSLCRMQTANPRAKIESKSYHLIVIDECFPAGTPVLTTEGWVPIDEIVNGNRRDWIVATQEADGSLGWGNVRTGYRTPRLNRLVRVVHEDGAVVCTANHPFVVGDDRVPAIDLVPGQDLLLVPGAPQPAWSQGEELGHAVLHAEVPSWAYATVGADLGGQEPIQERGDTSEDQFDSEEDWASAIGAGRQWSRDDRRTADTLHSAGRGLGGRMCLPRWRRSEDWWSPDALQGRPVQQGAEADRGSGRVFPHFHRSASAGCSQGAVAHRSRVVRVEVLQPGDPVFADVSDGGDHVYSLEVDSASHTYVANGVLVGNCQEADDYTISKSIHPMGAFYNATIVKTGTPARVKGNFYKAIQRNKRRQTKRGIRQNHFEFNWRYCAKYNKNYASFIKKEKVRIGEDSDEFQLSYELRWLLDRGMFITEGRFAELGDVSMEISKAYWHSPVLVGIDVAKSVDSTVVTVVHVDWEHPDEFGLFPHRVLNWLELQGENWEEQYFQIVDFLAAYDVFAIGVDGQGLGDVVADRLQRLMPRVEVHAIESTVPAQSERWKHLTTLIERDMIVWPAHSRARRTKQWQRFSQQMTDCVKEFRGPNLLVAAPDEADAHDDYVDSLALACALTIDVSMPEIQESSNPFYR